MTSKCSSGVVVARRLLSSAPRLLSPRTTVPATRPVISSPTWARSLSTTQPGCSSETPKPKGNLPTKETLLRIDWMLEHLTPGLLKSRLSPFFDSCKADVTFEDKLYNYKLSTKSQLHSHIAKIRMYYRYLSPYNKVERIGSCIYEGEDVIVLLWRLSTLESNIWTYFPSFITKKEPKLLTVEGALDIHVTAEGAVYKVVNRKITAADREGARVMAKIKETQEEIEKKEQEKQLRREAEELVEEQKRRGLL